MSSDRVGFGGFGGRRPDHDPRPSPAARGNAAHGLDAHDRRDHDDHGHYTVWKKADFPTDDTLRPCKVKRHEDLPSHIYSEEFAVPEMKCRPWVARRGMRASVHHARSREVYGCKSI